MTDRASASGNRQQQLTASSTPGEAAVGRFRELLSSRGPEVSAELIEEFGWQVPLVISCDPPPYCIPQELFSFRPKESEVFKIFFKGTSKEVRIRQVFFHTELSAEEQQWLIEFRKYCAKENFKIPVFLQSMILRIIWLAYRKWGDNIIHRSFELSKAMLEWRRNFFPLSDQEEELTTMMKTGVMYWVGRDQSLRPLMVIRLARLHKHAAPETFKRLTIFCFEWALRFLMVPGIVETITVLLDVRGVPLHQFPVSALTDMTSTLTKQYPFRLNRMLIINDSFFVQTVWNIAKQFLTEVQQQKMLFMRSGYEEELLKDYTPWQLEKCYGGTRAEITSFYPFPVAPGPYVVGTTEREDPYKNGYLALDRVTSMGVLWEGRCRMPIQWGAEAARVFRDLSLPVPEGAASALTSLVAETDSEMKKAESREELSFSEFAAAATEPTAATEIPPPPLAAPVPVVQAPASKLVEAHSHSSSSQQAESGGVPPADSHAKEKEAEEEGGKPTKGEEVIEEQQTTKLEEDVAGGETAAQTAEELQTKPAEQAAPAAAAAAPEQTMRWGRMSSKKVTCWLANEFGVRQSECS
ncbi:hypothetical protein Efla_007141 [Eimeria flavescens]